MAHLLVTPSPPSASSKARRSRWTVRWQRNPRWSNTLSKRERQL